MPELWIVRPGTVPYRRAWAWQRALVERRAAGDIPDTVLLLEHPHVYTIGRRGSDTDVLADAAWLAANGAEVVRSDRGGQVTYHGPGQLVGYPIFLLRQPERDLHVYLRNLEEALIRALARFELPSTRKEGWTGVWNATAERKLASIGVAVKRWVTLHGFALNVSTNLARFSAINPCGLEASVMGSMQSVLGREVPFAAVKDAVGEAMGEVFARKFV
jgi:lipoate-protein ligase B